MSDVEVSEGRDTKTGRFLVGNKPPGGRPLGSRNKLGEAFLDDLRSVWESHGKQALIDCAESEPAQFVRVLASLMPRDINLNVAVDVTEFAGRFRNALELLGNEPVLPKPRRSLRVIDHG